MKITISGLIPVMAQVLQHSQYPDRHVYWDLTQADMGLSIGDRREIIGVLRLYQPEKKSFSDRSSLLVSGSLNRAMGDLFVSMAKVLPFKYRIFTDPEEAEAYLCQD